MKWYECKISEEEIAQAKLFDFFKKCEQSFTDAGWPENAAIFQDVNFATDGVNLWLTDTAAEIVEKAGFRWREYYVKDLSKPPSKTKSALLIGQKSAWELLI